MNLLSAVCRATGHKISHLAGGAAPNRDSGGRGHTDGAVAQRRLPAQRSADPPLPAPVVLPPSSPRLVPVIIAHALIPLPPSIFSAGPACGLILDMVSGLPLLGAF